MSIYKFKNGDKITRIQPSKVIAKISDEEILNRNYIGTPFIFIGIANGCIYLRRVASPEIKSFLSIIKKDLDFLPKGLMEDIALMNIELEIFEEGWSYYIDPMTLGSNKINKISTKDLKKKLNIALKTENYEEALRLQKLLKNG